MAGSTGGFATSVATGSATAVKLFSVALFAQTQKQPGFSRTLTGPMPSKENAFSKMKAQSSADMPVVRIDDLSKTAGEKVSVDMFNLIGGTPISGDTDAEGTGAALTSSSMDVRIDLLTKVVDCGGKMSQKRTKHDLRQVAMAQLVSYFARLDDQTTLVHLAGDRGDLATADWIVPVDSDGSFAATLVNTVQAPSYNRHYTVDGTSLGQSAAGVAAFTTTDIMSLDTLDALATLIDEMDYPLSPVKIADDPAKDDEPMFVLYLPPRLHQALLGSAATAGSLRSIQQAAWNRASYGSKHPLFKGEAGMWRNILIKKMNRSIRFNSGSSIRTSSDAAMASVTEANTNVPAGITAGFAIERGLLLGGQALANCYGANKSSDYHFSWLENWYNFKRALEVGGDCMGGKAKVRFDYGGKATDHGVLVIDSVVAL